MLRSVLWQSKKIWTARPGTEPLSWNVGSYQSSLRNIPEEGRSHLNLYGSLKSRILCAASSLTLVVPTCWLLYCTDVSSSDHMVQDVYSWTSGVERPRQASVTRGPLHPVGVGGANVPITKTYCGFFPWSFWQKAALWDTWE